MGREKGEARTGGEREKHIEELSSIFRFPPVNICSIFCADVMSHALHWYALLALSVDIEFVSSSARVTSVKSAKGLGLTQFQRLGLIDRSPGSGTPGSDKKTQFQGQGRLLTQKVPSVYSAGKAREDKPRNLHCPAWE